MNLCPSSLLVCFFCRKCSNISIADNSFSQNKISLEFLLVFFLCCFVVVVNFVFLAILCAVFSYLCKVTCKLTHVLVWYLSVYFVSRKYSWSRKIEFTRVYSCMKSPIIFYTKNRYNQQFSSLQAK